jgi:pectinesterase
MRFSCRFDLRLILLAVFAACFVRTNLSAETILTVAADGTGKFQTIQAAIDSIPDHDTNPCVIQIAPGRYAERVSVPRGKSFVTLRGLGKLRTDVIITGGADTIAVLKTSADDFRAENFTVENTAGQVGPQQALFSDGKRQVFENLLIQGWQDTLGSWNGNVAYFHNCEIRGSVDFIYSGGAAVFDRCDVIEIRESGGTLTAPSTPKAVEFGLVFLNCKLMKSPGVHANSTALMRPWRPDGQTAFINCTMDDHIPPKGWSEWDGREKTCRAAEYGSRNPDGSEVDLSKRASWVKILTAKEADAYSVTNILGGWNPLKSQ